MGRCTELRTIPVQTIVVVIVVVVVVVVIVVIVVVDCRLAWMTGGPVL